MPDIGSYINQNCAKSFILKHWPIANSYKECNLYKAHGTKYCSKAGLNSCPRKLVVEILWEHSNAFTASFPKILVGKTFKQGL